MTQVRSAIFPGVMIGSLLVAWLGIVAANRMPLPIIPAAAQGAPIQTELITSGQAQNGEIPPTVAEMAAGQQAAEQAPAAVPGNCSLGDHLPQSILQWCELVERYSAENGLDPSLVAAVMAQESGGNAQAYSKSGAVGLLQVMPRDGKAAGFMCINGPCFSDRPSTEELQDPEFNISYGTRMLSGLINRAGTIRDGLMRYGPENVGYYYADKVLAIYERYR